MNDPSWGIPHLLQGRYDTIYLIRLLGLTPDSRDSPCTPHIYYTHSSPPAHTITDPKSPTPNSQDSSLILTLIGLDPPKCTPHI